MLFAVTHLVPSGTSIDTIYVVAATIVTFATMCGLVEKRWKLLKRRWTVRRTIEELLLGSEAVVVNGNVIKAAVRSLPQRLDAGDLRFDVLDAHCEAIDVKIDQLAEDVIGRNGKPVTGQLADIAMKLGEHITDAASHQHLVSSLAISDATGRANVRADLELEREKHKPAELAS